MSDFDLVLTGRVVGTDRVRENGYVAIRGGLVERVGEGSPPSAVRREDFGSALILPGAIDAQVHSRSQAGQEDFIWSTHAAAAGGVTTIVDMPYDDAMLICDTERLSRKAREAGEQARVDFALYGTIHPDPGPAHIQEMVAAGAVGFKFSTFGSGTIMIGSHSDSVPSGGRFNGMASVIAGIEIIRALRDAGRVAKHSIEVVDFLAEEPSEYGLSCVGSRAMAGRLSEEMLVYRNAQGEFLATAIDRIVGDVANLATAKRNDIASFLELHIEQSRILEEARIDLGIVSAIASVTRVEIQFEGRTEDAMLTDNFLSALEARTETIAQTSHVKRSGWKILSTTKPALCDPDLRRTLKDSAESLGYSALDMASGAGHDAAFIATFAPSAMIFVLCRDGRSHTPDEWAEPEAIAAGAATLLETTMRLDETLGIHSSTEISI